MNNTAETPSSETTTPTTKVEPTAAPVAEKQLIELKLQIGKFDRWQQNEIDFCTHEIRMLLRKYQVSAALAVMIVAMEIAIKEGQ